MKTTCLLSSLCIVLLMATGVTCAQEQEREFTPFERQRFELDKVFAADILRDDGSRIRLSRFQVGTGLFRHKIETGDSQSGLLLALSNITRIVRVRNTPDRVTVVFLNGSEMSTRWSHYQLQKLWGITEDGKEWESTIDTVREIEIRQVTPPAQ